MADPTPEPQAPESLAPGRRRSGTFGPVVLVGLAATTLLAVGGSKPWVRPQSASQVVSPALDGNAGQVPLAGALGLVCLAAWGVLLVTRGRVRRGLAVLAVLAAAGAVATVATGRDDAARSLARELGLASVRASSTGWFWVTAVAAPLSLFAAVAAVRYAPTWPAMGSRYDAPGGETGAAAPTASSLPSPSSAEGTPSVATRATGDPEASDRDTHLDLWRALDRGHDPTA